MKLTAGTTISPVDTVTRQTLFDLVANMAHDQIEQTDIDQSDGLTATFVSGTPPIFHRPGQLWWNTTDQLMLVFTDVLEGTGVSLYLAWGPDRFDVACLAAEPIPFGAAVQLYSAKGGRWAGLPPTPHDLTAMGTNAIWETAKVIGFNNNVSQTTTASGTYLRR